VCVNRCAYVLCWDMLEHSDCAAPFATRKTKICTSVFFEWAIQMNKSTTAFCLLAKQLKELVCM